MRRGIARQGDTVYARLQDERRICLVELIDAKRKKTVTGKGWQPVGRTLIGETHHCTFHYCNLHARASLSTNHPNDVRHRRAGIRRPLFKPWWL